MAALLSITPKIIFSIELNDLSLNFSNKKFHNDFTFLHLNNKCTSVSVWLHELHVGVFVIFLMNKIYAWVNI